MYDSATSIEVTELSNVHRFFPVLLKLGKIKIVKYSNTIFWPIIRDWKVHFSFSQHCSSCNINFPSIATNKPQKWIHTIHRDTSIQSGHCNQEKKVYRQKMYGSHNKSTLVSATTTSSCTDQISQMILQETPRNLDPENIIKDNFNYEVSSYSAYKFLSVCIMLFCCSTPTAEKITLSLM